MDWSHALNVFVGVLIVLTLILISRKERHFAKTREDLEARERAVRTVISLYLLYLQSRTVFVEIKDFGEAFGEYRFRYQVAMNKDDFDGIRDEIGIEPVSPEPIYMPGHEGFDGPLTLVFAGSGESQTQALDEALSALATIRPEHVFVTYVTH